MPVDLFPESELPSHRGLDPGAKWRTGGKKDRGWGVGVEKNGKVQDSTATSHFRRFKHPHQEKKRTWKTVL